MIVPQGGLLTVDVLQVGSTTPGSDVTIQIVGEVLGDEPALETLGRMPRVNVRPKIAKYRSVPRDGLREITAAASQLNDHVDIAAERLDALDERVLNASIQYRSYNAVLSGVQAVAADLIPWVQVSTVAWRPIRGWIAARTAPVGAALIVDVKWSDDAETTVDAPVWNSIFEGGAGISLADGTNRRLVAAGNFAT